MGLKMILWLYLFWDIYTISQIESICSQNNFNSFTSCLDCILHVLARPLYFVVAACLFAHKFPEATLRRGSGARM